MKAINAVICLVAFASLGVSLLAKQDVDPTVCVVLITTDLARGTGFVCQFNGTNYVITNTHVLEGAQQFEFCTINNTKLNAVRIELANDRDLARVLIRDAEPPPLHIATSPPKMGDGIFVLGNSEGAGVITQLKGTIKGLGPDVMEVDAPFVSGNSGSPIVTASGDVLGVATFVTKPGITNWIEAGTPFTQARRFGVRLQGDIEWKPISVRQFYQESATLLDCGRFLEDSSQIVTILHSSEGLNQLSTVMAQQKAGDRQRYCDVQYSQMIMNFCNGLKSAETAYKRIGNVKSGSISAPLRAAEIQFHQFPQFPLRKLRQMKWSTKYFQDLASEYEKIFADWK